MSDNGTRMKMNEMFPVFHRIAPELIHLWQAAGCMFEISAGGTSMAPLIRTGDRLVVKCAAAGELTRGDIIVYFDGGVFIVHRLIDRRNHATGRQVCQKGDNLNGWTWIPETCVIGRVVRLRRDQHQWDLTGGLWPLIHWCAALPAAWGARMLDSPLSRLRIIQRSRGPISAAIRLIQQAWLRLMRGYAAGGSFCTPPHSGGRPGGGPAETTI